MTHGTRLLGSALCLDVCRLPLAVVPYRYKAEWHVPSRLPSSFQSPEHDALRLLLQEVRERSGFSQRELSLRLGESPNYVNKVESGARGVDLIGVIRLLKLTGSDREAFFRELFARLDRL